MSRSKRPSSSPFIPGSITWKADDSVPESLRGKTLTQGCEIDCPDGSGPAVKFAPVILDGERTYPIIRTATRPSLQAAVAESRAREAAKAEAKARADAEWAETKRRYSAELKVLAEPIVVHKWLELGQTVLATQKSRDAGGPEFVTCLGHKKVMGWDPYEDEAREEWNSLCRPATEDEAAPVRDRIAAREAAKAAAAELEAIAKRIRADGESPPRVDGLMHRVDGETVPIGQGQTIYGGGAWFEITPDWIWYIKNNGGDGDFWGSNNVATGGAGAIGYRVPATPELADSIRSLAATVKRGERADA